MLEAAGVRRREQAGSLVQARREEADGAGERRVPEEEDDEEDREEERQRLQPAFRAAHSRGQDRRHSRDRVQRELHGQAGAAGQRKVREIADVRNKGTREQADVKDKRIHVLKQQSCRKQEFSCRAPNLENINVRGWQSQFQFLLFIAYAKHLL